MILLYILMIAQIFMSHIKTSFCVQHDNCVKTISFYWPVVYVSRFGPFIWNVDPLYPHIYLSHTCNPGAAGHDILLHLAAERLSQLNPTNMMAWCNTECKFYSCKIVGETHTAYGINHYPWETERADKVKWNLP